jgi:hypothetical protein
MAWLKTNEDKDAGPMLKSGTPGHPVYSAWRTLPCSTFDQF